MPWFKCAVCAEKDSRIADLKDQLDKVMALHKSIVSPHYANVVELDANRALDGAGTPQIEITPDKREEMSAVERQALEILTGSY